ncbi:MAG: redoxin domain-containing protein [Armatimonadetes bacterium]|nr:redoxin domain-containing protein [Akkermansiaceae bacterium]
MAKILILLSLLLSLRAPATLAEAQRIQRGYELASEKWVLEMKLATTPQARQELQMKQPKPTPTAIELWRAIGTSLQEDWTIPHAAFFLNISRNLTTTDQQGIPQVAFVKERQLILKTFAEHHLAKPDILPFCIALIDSQDPQAISLLEKIQAENPDKSIQGVAALGAALLLKPLGDDPEVMKKRLTYLRSAIIHSADQKIGQTSVADIVTDELYVIKYLSKGRDAPDLSGTDVAGRPVKLSDLRGKIVVLLFWDARMAETDKIIQITNQLVTKFRGKAVAVLGITSEPIERIRSLQADDSIMWNNIHDSTDKLAWEYRITFRPAVFILDGVGKIQYTGLPGSFVEITVDALLVGEAPKK